MSNSPQNFYKKLLGLKGEAIAEKYLVKLGYKTLLKNYVTPFGEADLVCKKGEEIVFVEVKTRSSNKFGAPSEAVGYKKQKKYRDIANYYLKTNNLDNAIISFAVVEVIGDSVNLITDAF